jgi:aryl-alcohol dehydrogenase-like predicted oxidoreductase
MSGFSARTLGKTGLKVSPLGIGGGSGISSEDVLYAFERGVNYFFFSSDLHHFRYGKSAEALRKLCQRGSAVRDQVVLATVSYINNPEKLIGILMDQFFELGVDYIDVFHWGWVNEKDDCTELFKSAQSMKDGGATTQFFRETFTKMEEVNQELLNRGLVRYVGASFHSRALARQWMGELDVLMLRYNLAHLGVEVGIFPLLPQDKTQRPGTVVFNVGHEGTRLISDPPPGLAPDVFIPTLPDCYRYALSNPNVDLVLTGVQNRAQLDEALAALEKGEFSPAECEQLREYGAAWRAAYSTTTYGSKLLRFVGYGS